VACWTHARRKFFQAKDTDARRAGELLRLLQRLDRIETAIKARIERKRVSTPDLTGVQRHELTGAARQRYSTRVRTKIKSWLDPERMIARPRSPMGAAITYPLDYWTVLTSGTQQGYLKIDNNAAERALKRVAIGRKNCLFAGTEEAGASHARLWTLIASSQWHGLDPQPYLTNVLAKITTSKLSNAGQFLPDVWKAEDAAKPQKA